MLDYFQNYYIEMNFGPGYVATDVAYVAAAVLLLSDCERSWRGVLRKAAEIFLCWLGSVVYCSVYWKLFPSDWPDQSMMVVFLAFYALVRCPYRPMTRLVRSCVFLSCFVQSIPISEPVGELLENNFGMGSWVEHLTSVIVVLMTAAVVLFLRHFSIESLTFVPTFPAVLVTAAAGMGVLLQWGGKALDPPRSFNVPVACCFWLLELLAYYMFYVVSREYDRNLELQTIRQKEAMEANMLHFSQKTYEEMHEIRHEVKNHLAYLRVLAEQGKYDKLRQYLDTVSGETEGLFQIVECGNDVVNAVMNYAIKEAKAAGVLVEQQIVVPPRLPYQETELCSLLFNLMDNAIEAAAQSGREAPVVSVSIRPQQDYLFLRVTNPVGDQLTAGQRLSLRTSKQDARTHGYGTKIIRRVAEQNQGSAKFSMDGGRFVADVMLYLKEEQDGDIVSGDL